MQHTPSPSLACLRAAASAVVSLAALVGLSGCGGGNGPAAESAHWQSAVIGSQAAGWTWLIFDPAAPAGSRVSQALHAASFPPGQLVLGQRSYDSAARTVTQLGSNLAFVADGGKLWRADLRGGQSHRPVVVSSLSDACSVDSVLPLNAAGDDAWLVVSAHAGQQACFTKYLVRSSWGVSQSAIALGSIRLLTVLGDDNGSALALLAAVPAPNGAGEWLQAYDTAFQSLAPLPPPAGNAGVDFPAAFVALDGAQGGSGYVSANAQLRRLRWSAGSVTLDAAPLYSFVNSPADPAALPHAGGLYLADGNQVLDVQAGGGSTLLATLQAGERVREFGATSTHLVLVSDLDFSVAHFVQSVPVAGGVPITLLAGFMTQDVALVGVSGDWVVTAYGGLQAAGTYRRMLADGSQATTLTDVGAGPVLSATAPIGGVPALHGVLACTAPMAAGGPPCGPGPLLEIDAAGQATTTLGSLGGSGGVADGTALQGMPGLVQLRDAAATAQDVLIFKPGVAASLQRLSNFVP